MDHTCAIYNPEDIIDGHGIYNIPWNYIWIAHPLWSIIQVAIMDGCVIYIILPLIIDQACPIYDLWDNYRWILYL